MQASAKSATVSTAKAKPARKTRARKAPVTPRTRKATALDSTPKSANSVEKVETSNPTKSIFDFKDLTELRGLDFVVLPLIFLEAFTVNILQNAGFTVPPRVAIK
tara:strand:+ start:843 stop:1157 length:315 start_codon:yes stop_codon:yes gene_type:complete